MDKPIEGIVVSMNPRRRTARVRVFLDADRTHPVAFSNRPYMPLDVFGTIYMDGVAGGTGVHIGSIIKIINYSGMDQCKVDVRVETAKNHADFDIISFEVTDEESWKKNEIVVVIEKKRHFFRVIGSEYDTVVSSVPVTEDVSHWKNINAHDYVLGEIKELPPFYACKEVAGGFVAIEYDHAAREQYIRNHKWIKKVPICFVMRRIRLPSEEDTEAVSQQTRNWSGELSYEQAVSYVRNPLLCVSCLEDFLEMNDRKEFSCSVNNVGIRALENGECSVTIPRNAEINECLSRIGRFCWRAGVQLELVRNGRFKKMKVALILNEISPGELELLSAPGEEQQCEAFYRHTERQTRFELGPSQPKEYVKRRVVKDSFEKFFKRNSQLFLQFCGRGQVFEPISPPALDRDYFLTGPTPDNSQKSCLETALAVDGFVCISAPPGSGKTFLISALVDAKLQTQPETRFAICSTTNVAVTNAMEGIQRRMKNAKCIREYGSQAESELYQNSEASRLSLRRLVNDQDLLQEMMEHHVDLKEAHTQFVKARERLNIQAECIEKQCMTVEDFKAMERKVQKLTLRYYSPKIYGTTAALFMGKEHEEIDHLIVDEGSQLSIPDALALYCSLPSLRSVTVVGDSQQLGPYTDTLLNPGSLAYAILRTGELTRLEGLSSINRNKLSTIYRSHPRIVELLLRPLYGPTLRAGTTSEARNMAAAMNLPRAADGSPVLMIHVNGIEIGGKNAVELEVVIDFINHLRRRGVNPEELVVLCHHCAQKEALCHQLLNQPHEVERKFGKLIQVKTVDSYQGKESKIVLLLTTKTMSEANDLSALKFVSDRRRETVAVSRAQHAIYLFGNWKQLNETKFWGELIPGIYAIGGIVDSNGEQMP